MPKTKKTVKDILEQHQREQGIEVDAEFARALGVKRQSLYAWKQGEYAPQLNWLRITAFMNWETWKGRMAVDLLKVMGHEDQVPTVAHNPRFQDEPSGKLEV